MKRISVLLFGLLSLTFCNGQTTSPFPLTDLHVHCKGGFTLDDAVVKSKKEGIKYGVVTNVGVGFPVHTDGQIDSVINSLKNYPMFLFGMQAEGREWLDNFSKASYSRFDYVFTDAMTFTDAKGRRNRIWLKEETWIDNEEEFMNYLVNTIVKIVSTEPINMYVNSTYLPAQMADRYDSFWTTERMDRVIKAAKDHNIAIEINNRFKIPSAAFITRAKNAGIKFTVGTNNMDANFGGAEYAIEMINKCHLTQADFYQPVRKK